MKDELGAVAVAQAAQLAIMAVAGQDPTALLRPGSMLSRLSGLRVELNEAERPRANNWMRLDDFPEVPPSERLCDKGVPSQADVDREMFRRRYGQPSLRRQEV